MSHLVEIQKTLCTCRLLVVGISNISTKHRARNFHCIHRARSARSSCKVTAVTEGHSGNSEMLQAATSRSVDVFEKLEQVGEGTYGQVR